MSSLISKSPASLLKMFLLQQTNLKLHGTQGDLPNRLVCENQKSTVLAPLLTTVIDVKLLFEN